MKPSGPTSKSTAWKASSHAAERGDRACALPQECAVRLERTSVRLFVRRNALRFVRRGTLVAALVLPTLPLCAFRRARFQIFRVEAASLRALLDSRLASFNRLRARFSSSLAMRTRCLATSACSLARSIGSAASAGSGVAVPRGGISLPVFFI